MKDISPKKYIETRVRNLPIYKCFVNSGWEEAGMANVIVTRKHVNGNVTAGIYLIDLLCLGVKDTMFKFNESEESLMDSLPDLKEYLTEVEYPLAHNIIYAGHDFALEYDINPHPDFKTTRFILEEDNDDIPIIDIAVGDEDGLPSLILQPGQSFKYRHILDKLEKKLGKGNFNFYEEEEEDFDEEDELEDEDDQFPSRIEDYKVGSISPYAVRFIEIKDLMDKAKTKDRTHYELAVIETELKLRMLGVIKPDLFNELDVEDREEYSYVVNAPEYPESITNEMESEIAEMTSHYIEFMTQAEEEGTLNTSFKEEYIIKLLKKHNTNPVIVSGLLEEAILFRFESATEQAKIFIKRMSLQYPVAKLALALYVAATETEGSLVNYVLEGKDIHSIFPLVETFSLKELYFYWLAKTFYSLQIDNLQDAIYFYELAVETDMQSPLIMQVQFLLVEKMNKIFKDYEDKG